jgi:phosphatidylglycerol:prolipoprotein diacylglycerol transferase
MSVEQREGPTRRYRDAKKAYDEAKAAGAEETQVKQLELVMNAAGAAKKKHDTELSLLRYAQRFPSRNVPTRMTSVSELEQLAAQFPSLPVHPTQLYSAINALLLCGLLGVVFQQRRRHGVVFGLLLVLYPIGRFVLEMVRTDNPREVLGMTVSQSVCVAMFASGLIVLWVLYAKMPVRSPALANERGAGRAANSEG